MAPAVAGELDFPHVPGHLTVKFQPGTPDDVVASINGMLGAHVGANFRLDPDLRLMILPEAANLDPALSVYRSQPEVRYAEPDYLRTTQLIPNDTRFGELWGMHNTGQSGGLVDFDIDGPEGWDINTGAPGIVIGSIDTGVDPNHEDLAANLWTNPGEVAGNGVDDDANGGYRNSWMLIDSSAW